MTADTHFSAEEIKRAVDNYIEQQLTQRYDEASELGVSYQRLWRHIRDVTLHGGKRIRPYLTFVGYGSYDEKLLPVAVAQELLHIAMLMHDDVIDQDDIRRGHPNINGTYREIYAPFLDTDQARHYAYSAAILAGDTLLSESYRLIHDAGFDAKVTSKITAQHHLAVYEVIGGELLDVEAGFVTDIDFDPLLIYRYKTSSYSFVAPLLAGAYCAGADEETIAVLHEYASNAGIAFQIQDDLLGVYGDEDETGKSIYTDLREGKQTMLIKYHKELMTPEQHERFATFGQSSATDNQLRMLKDDMVASGARDKTAKLADQYFAMADEQLDAMPDDGRTAELRQFTELLRARRS